MDNISYGSLDDCAAATIIQYRNTPHSGHWGINPPPSFRQSPLYIGFSRPPLKSDLSVNPKKY